MTLRLKRRRAFSNDSPSCSRTSAIISSSQLDDPVSSLLSLRHAQLNLMPETLWSEKRGALIPNNHRRSCRHHPLFRLLPLRPLPRRALAAGGDRVPPNSERENLVPSYEKSPFHSLTGLRTEVRTNASCLAAVTKLKCRS